MRIRIVLLAAAFAVTSFAASAQNYPAPKRGEWIAKDFKFHTGDVLPQMKLAYTTIGEPTGIPVVVLHGTGGSAASMLTLGFAGELFGPGQPLDASKYYIVIPDALGHGGSAKPSDGMKAKFPQYNYSDMVDAQYRLVSEGLGIRHVRLVIGNSMGGMNVWLWGVKYPDYMDALVPMAAQPTAMSSRNWMLRRLLIETVKADPGYNGGNYTSQPKSMRLAYVCYSTATNGGDQAYHRLAPTRAAADALVDERMAAPFNTDANDFIYAWAAAADYDPAPRLREIKAAVLAILAADDERNPISTGATEAAMKAIPNGRLHVIPASPHTAGHGTTGQLSRLWEPVLREFLAGVPRR